MKKGYLLFSFLVVSLVASFSRGFDRQDIIDARGSTEIRLWQSDFFQRVSELVGENHEIFFRNVANTNLNVGSLTWKLNKIYESKRDTLARRDSSKPLKAYLQPFVTYNKAEIGLSQLVLESAIACGTLTHGSSIKRDVCTAYPKLAISVLRIMNSHVPNPDSSFDSYYRFTYKKHEVHPDRGAVLARAFVPVYMALQVEHSDINSGNWTSSLREELTSKITRMNEIIYLSLRDFHMRRVMTYYGMKKSKSESFFNEHLSKFRQDRALPECKKVRDNTGNHDDKICTSNHIMAMHLGLLMTQDKLGRSKAQSIAAFEQLIEEGIEFRNDHAVMSDRFRTFDTKKYKKDGKTVTVQKASGIGYSFLQLRILTLGAEILKDQTDLYTYSRNKLLKALNFISRIANAKQMDNSIYFSRASRVRGKIFHQAEFKKYINKAVDGDREAEAKRLTWAKNFGFLLIPKSRACTRSSWYRRTFSYLCMTSHNLNRTRYSTNSIARPVSHIDQLIEDGWVGPAQILYNY